MPPFYAVVNDFRPVGVLPQTPLASGVLRPRGISCHTTEGGEGEAGFIGTVNNVLIALPERSASYHEGWYPKNGGFEARRIVRPEHAAHSMNPRRPPWREPPLARVARILGDRWWDPNAASYAVSIAGSTGVTVPKLSGDLGFMAGARRRYAELQRQFASSLVPDPLFNHGEGQADRTDWGTFRAALLATPPPIQEDDMLNDLLKSAEAITNRTAFLAAGGTGRSTPAFNPQNYGENIVLPLTHASSGPALFWVSGTNLTLDTGEVYDARTRWLATWGRGRGLMFWHERDVIRLEAREPVAEADCAGEVSQAEQEAAATVNKQWREWMTTAPGS